MTLKRVLLAQGSTQPSDPIIGLAKEFRGQGIQVLLGGGPLSFNPVRWMNLAMRSQAIVFIRYDNGDGCFVQSQLYRAKLFGRPVVRWWVGTDVLNSISSEDAIRAARHIDQAVDLNIAVSPHLVTELQEIGIEAQYVPSLCETGSFENAPVEDLPQGVLSYLPTGRRAFYGEDVVISAIEANPDLPFFIVGDQSHALQHYPNVTSLGWTENLDDIWSKVGLLLRVTEHDGMPRMVLDALARSRYVIYSEVFEGCWHARSAKEVLEHLKYFRTQTTLNEAGPGITESLSATAGALYTESLTRIIHHPLSPGRLKTIIASIFRLPILLPGRLKWFSSRLNLK